MSDSKRKRILIVVPVFQAVYPKPFLNFTAMFMKTAHEEGSKYEFCVTVPDREILHNAMNTRASMVLSEGFDAMVVADDDCFPPLDAVCRLLRHYEAGIDVVAGLGIMRGYPYTTTVGRYFPEGMSIVLDGGKPRASGFQWVEDTSREPDLLQADFCGFPIALISRAALAKIEAPWFGTWIDGGSCTHDVFFGVKCKAAGVSIHVDKTIECGHLAESPILTVHNRDLIRQAAATLQSTSGRS